MYGVVTYFAAEACKSHQYTWSNVNDSEHIAAWLETQDSVHVPLTYEVDSLKQNTSVIAEKHTSQTCHNLLPKVVNPKQSGVLRQV